MMGEYPVQNWDLHNPDLDILLHILCKGAILQLYHFRIFINLLENIYGRFSGRTSEVIFNIYGHKIKSIDNDK